MGAVSPLRIAKLVTIKLPKNAKHDPLHKVTGPCVVSEVCTDSTGEHHTMLVTTESEYKELTEHFHITRVEDVK